MEDEHEERCRDQIGLGGNADQTRSCGNADQIRHQPATPVRLRRAELAVEMDDRAVADWHWCGVHVGGRQSWEEDKEKKEEQEREDRVRQQVEADGKDELSQ